MKIAFIVRSFPEISETFILNQVRGLIDEGHEVKIFSISDPERELVHGIFEEYNFRENTSYFNSPQSYSQSLKQTPLETLKILANRPMSFFQVLSFVKNPKLAPRKISGMKTFLNQKEEFDVIHCHFGPTGEEFSFLKDISNAKFVTSFYGRDVSQVPAERPGFYSDVFEKSDKILALTDNMREDLKQIGCKEEKIEKVPLGIDIDQFKFKAREKKEDEPYKILTIGRFVEKKGIKYGLEAVSQLKDKYEIEYNIVGDGELREEIEQKIKEENLEENVNLLGYVEYSELTEIMHENHVLLAPSVTAEDGDKEGAPMVIIEAQATGMPIISTKHSGIPEIVKKGESAYLAEEKDSEQLTEKLKNMLEESRDWKQKGLPGRKFIEATHTVEEMIENLESAYTS